jgi:NitT/TauT family transport system permease protein
VASYIADKSAAVAPDSSPAAPPVRAEVRWWSGDLIPTLVVVALIVAAIQIGSFFLPPFVLPAPLTILRATWEVLGDPIHIGITALRLLAAVLFAMVVGVLFGVVMGVFLRVRPYLQALVVIDTGIPALSWMLLAVFWFRNAEARIFFILSVILIPFYALSIYDGIRALPRDWVEMIESFRPRRRQVLRYLIAPHIVPYILTTTKSVIGYAIRMVIFAELIASAVGIGSRMSLAQSTFRIDRVFAWTLLLVIFNLAIQAAITGLDKMLLRWRPEARVR